MKRRTLLAQATVLGGLGIAGRTGDGGGDGETTADETTAAPTATDAQPTEAPTTEPPTTTTSAPTTVSGPPGSDVTNTLEDNSFDPVVASVDSDAIVEWVNQDGVEHVVEATQFNDGVESWTFFARLEDGDGTTSRISDDVVYEYYWTIHGEATMCGVVLVGDVSQAGPLPCQSEGGGSTPDY